MHSVVRFFRTPKGLLLLFLVLLATIAAPGQGAGAVWLNIGAAVFAAGAVDLILVRLRERVWLFPSGAILTAMIVTMVMRAQEHWYVPVVTSVVAILSKYVIRTRSANVLNPAALALVVMPYLLPMGQSWWGALPDVAPLWLHAVLLIGGVFIADRVNKMPLVLAFLGVYFALFAATAYLGQPLPVAEIFRSPDAEAALFFALIILTDPPTSPAKYRDQLICGVMVAVISYAVFELIGVVYYLLAGALAGNVWAAWRRVHRRSQHAFPQKLVEFLRAISPLATSG